jgi:deoxyhypusine synthase
MAEDELDEYRDPEVRKQTRCKVFLGYTSNLISSGLREVILHLVKHKHVSAIVTTAGGIEEDFIKCLGKTYLADFNLDGAELRKRGMNRIGNLIVPNDNYCKFEDWLTPILDTMLAEQKETGQVWSPSTFIRRLGKEINNEESVYYWAYKVNIGFCCVVQELKRIVERYTCFLPGTHRWLVGGHDILPFFSQPWLDCGHCTRYPSS